MYLVVSVPVAWQASDSILNNDGHRYTSCDEATTDRKKAVPKQANISVYVGEDGKKALKNFLIERNYHDRCPHSVCVVKNAAEADHHVYKPLYGQQVAFRLKGIVQTDSGYMAGVGSISSLGGVIEDDNFVASMPFVHPTATQDSVDVMLTLPTRLQKVKDIKEPSYWRGRLPSRMIGGVYYPPISNVSYTPLPLTKQIVVAGRLCGDQYADENGLCTYDRDLDELERDLNGDASVVVTEDGKEVMDTCPVCEYIKRGPCKDEFLSWEGCLLNLQDGEELTKCFQVTRELMKCYLKHEYYDVFTAGVDTKKYGDFINSSNESDK